MSEISAQNFLDHLKNLDDDFVILDVRTPWEWQEKKLSDSRMQFVEMQNIPAFLKNLPEDKKIFVLCRSGNRSAMVTEFLMQSGKNAVNVQGGMMEVGFLQSLHQ